MHEVMTAIRSVERAITSAPHSPGWRRLVGNRLTGLRGAYILYLEHSMGSSAATVDDSPWLSARTLRLRRDQAKIADELDRLIDSCSQHGDAEALRHQVVDLLGRVVRSRQREIGLIYESIDVDLGGEQ